MKVNSLTWRLLLGHKNSFWVIRASATLKRMSIQDSLHQDSTHGQRDACSAPRMDFEIREHPSSSHEFVRRAWALMVDVLPSGSLTSYHFDIRHHSDLSATSLGSLSGMGRDFHLRETQMDNFHSTSVRLRSKSRSIYILVGTIFGTMH